ncbi:MAG: G1 family glutamic endopeptidase [Candidatus Dormibacteria bacterium]
MSGTSITNTNADVGDAYHSLTPYRLVDTRAGSGKYGAGESLGSGGTLTFPVAGQDGVPNTAAAAALNVTATDTTQASYLSLYPAGGTQPLVSNLNWAGGDTVPNLVLVPLGDDGEVTAYNHLGNTNLVVDLEGYFAPEVSGSSAGSYVALTPTRIMDTRSGSGYQGQGHPLGPRATTDLPVSGQGGLPGSGEIDAVVLNVTVTGTTQPSYLTVYPKGAAQPLASNLNWARGQTIPNRVVVPLGSGGLLSLYNFAGDTDVVVDVDGYFTQGTSTPQGAGLYTPVEPERIIDTRAGSGYDLSGETLVSDSYVSDSLSQVGSLGSDVTAVVSNVTVTDTTAPSFLTVYPGPNLPVASDLNWSPGMTAANLTVATVNSSGDVSFYNDQGAAELVVDVFGYFSSTATLDQDGYTQSYNWSGYIEGNGPNTGATGTFVVPSLNRNDADGTNMAEWVGLDGWESDTPLIQAGIDEYPDSSEPGYFWLIPWWEILPAPETPITTLATQVAVGDDVTIAISQVSGSTWGISFTDDTTGDNFTTYQTYSGTGLTAEWIMEAPMDSAGDVYPLAAYSPTEFADLSTQGSDTVDAALYMVQNDEIVSVPSEVSEGGLSFNVAYGDTIPSAPA